MNNKIISFDFDDTLCMEADGSANLLMIELVRKYTEQGFKCHIVTARNKKNESLKCIQNNKNRIRVKDFIKEHNLPIERCHFTNHELKGRILKKIGAIKHYDDDKEQLASAEEYGVEAINSLI